MRKIIFENPGVISETAITTFGISSKEKESAIGFFGTGLKYAIAIALREGCNITIFAGTKELKFNLKQEKVRVDNFSIVTMNRRKLGFTTELGKNWTVENAFRELYCNTLDEDGECYVTQDEIRPKPGVTTIVVTGDKFLDCFYNLDKIILQSKPLEVLPNLEIHPKPSQHVYYRNVKVCTLPKPTRFTYNILTPLELTEDRTVKYPYKIEREILRAVEQYLENVDIFNEIFFCDDTYTEHGINYEYSTDGGEFFLSKCLEFAEAGGAKLNHSIRRLVRKIKPKHIMFDSYDLSSLEQDKLDKCISFLKELNYEVDKYSIVVTKGLETNVLGLAENDTIFINHGVFLLGNQLLAGTILEEYLHLEYKFYDCSRDLQNYLLNKLIGLGEETLGISL